MEPITAVYGICLKIDASSESDKSVFSDLS